MSGETVLITGASGFIGSHVTRYLLAEGSRTVVAITRKSSGDLRARELAERGACVIQGSFYGREVLNRIFENHRVRAVVHLAALRGAGNGQWADYEEVNILGTQRLLEAALERGVEKFIFCSSVGVHGTVPGELPARVDTPLRGDNEYHLSKILAEREVLESISRGLNALILRPTITYGSGDTGFPRMLVHLVKTKRLLLPRREVKIHLLDVAGFAKLVGRVLDSPVPAQRTFFAADADAVSLQRLADLIHRFHFQTAYPTYLRLPQAFFEILAGVGKAVNNGKWTTRVKLISRDWYYNLQSTIDEFGYAPSNTYETFIQSLGRG